MISSEWAEIQDFPNDAKYKKEKQLGSRHENVELNRYNDIVAYDQTCVKLKKVNYINANWIECKWTGQKYIATQGIVFIKRIKNCCGDQNMLPMSVYLYFH